MGGRHSVLWSRIHLAICLLLAAVPVAFALTRASTAALRDALLPAGLFLVLHVLARRFPVRLLGRDDVTQVPTATPFGYAVLLTAELPIAVLALAAAALVPTRRGKGHTPRPRLLLLELGRATLLFASAGVVLHALVPADHLLGQMPSVLTLAALVVAALIGHVVDVCIGASATAVSQGIALSTVLRQDRSDFDLISHLLQVGLAPVVVIVAGHSLLLVPLVLLAVVELYRSSRAAAERRHESLHDPLTGLPNRRMLDLRLAVLTEARADDRFALLLMDLDQFKEVNDRLGHHLGDQLLAKVGTRLEALDGVDIAARLGGDEFAFVVRRVGTNGQLLTTGERLVAEVSRPYVVQDVRLSIGASVGIATFPEHGQDVSTLMRRADSAMYSAKRSGVAVGLATVRNDAGVPGRVSLLGELEDALGRDELRLNYQPQVSLRTGEVVGVESLLRWYHPEHGLVMPGAFVETVEHTELIAPLTRYVIDRALSDMTQWVEAGVTVPVAVNISARDLQDTRFPRDLVQLLDDHGAVPGQLTLEITENALLGDRDRAGQVLAALTELGVTLSIDDFGTGYSSLAALRELPVQEVKLDRSFVLGMEESVAGTAIVRSVIQLAHALGLRVVAEGVENEGARRELESYGCSVVQGYLMSRPLPPHLVVPWIRAYGAARRAERESVPASSVTVSTGPGIAPLGSAS